MNNEFSIKERACDGRGRPSGTRRLGLADLRPASPGQLALVGLGSLLVGALVPVVGALLLPLGVIVLVVAGLGALARPRPRVTYWRGRRIDLDDQPSLSGRLYRALFRR